MTTPSSPGNARGTAYVSKRRFAEIKSMLEAKLENEALSHDVLESIQRILQFDPNVSTYTAEHGRRVCEQRKKAQQETGESLYVIAGVQRAYHKKKAARVACSLCHGDAALNPAYEGHCLRCFIHTHPDNTVVRNFKTKERAVADFIAAAFPDLPWVFDKRVEGGCSRRRPDVLADLGSCVLIVEVDENEHSSYDCTCENKRLMQLFMDAGSRPLIMIRFNPDAYVQRSGTEVKSCWGVTKAQELCIVKPSKKVEWSCRLAALKNAVDLQLELIKDVEQLREISVVHLFYDED